MTDPAQELCNHGLTVCRGLLSGEDAFSLRRVVNAIYDNLSSCPISDRLLRENFRSWHGVWLKPLPGHLRRHDRDLLEEYLRLLGALQERIGLALGKRWRFFAKRSFFRRHTGMAKQVPWHVDADAAAIFRVASSAINVWMPLDVVGSDLPSLEVVPGSHLVMKRRPMLTGKERYRDDAFVRAVGPSMVPVLSPGDALVFDQFVLHRTQDLHAGNIVRTACEFRFTSLDFPTLNGVCGWLRYAGRSAYGAIRRT